ncbi:hypothetical protein [Kibdelosporangium aridum]|uniref:hypothetical protein n=1 Tax=Kibdelosporangium aridum TaxID=2030 RepID=UPI000524A842
MASPAEIERKMRQLNNDVLSLYEALAEVQATQKQQGHRLNEMLATRAGHGPEAGHHPEPVARQRVLAVDRRPAGGVITKFRRIPMWPSSVRYLAASLVVRTFVPRSAMGSSDLWPHS